MKWSILILTMFERKHLLDRLLDCLAPQVEPHGDIEVMVTKSDPQSSIGENRQRMLDRALGEYVNFIDDDDMVAENYVALIYPLLNGVDYVGFPVNVFRDGVRYGTAYHSLKNVGWSSYGDVSFRDISHLNPIRREIAVKVRMDGDFGEDHRWADGLRQLGIVKTQNYIPDAMYFYYMRTHKPEMMSVEVTA